MSQLKVNSIVDANGGSSAVLYGVASPPNSMGFRNRIINGAHDINQRGLTSTTPFPAGTYYLTDRWAAVFNVNGRFGFIYNLGSVAMPAGFTNSLAAACIGPAAVGAAEYWTIQQRIEGYNVADLGWGAVGAQAVTLSFWARSNQTGTFGGAIQNSAANRSYPFSFTIAAANTWEFKTVSIAGDTTGTWLKDSGIGLSLVFSLGAGSTFTGTAGAWAAGNLVGVTGQVQLATTNNANLYITGVQLEAGSVATPFERRDYGRELIMCQRYFQIWYAGWAGVSGGAGYQYTSGVDFKVEMRAAPTFGVINQTNSARYPSANYFVGAANQYGGHVGYAATSSGGNDNWTVTGTANIEL